MLYHGSNILITDKLMPRTSFDYTPFVYATSDWHYALVRCGRFDVHKMNFKEDYDGGSYTLIELSSGAAERVLDTDGYIYTVDPSSFVLHQDYILNEFVSVEPCNILSTERIPNVLSAVLSDPFCKIIRYGTDEEHEYWKTVRGGREGYLERREARLNQFVRS